jgi:hypothetical protein
MLWIFYLHKVETTFFQTFKYIGEIWKKLNLRPRLDYLRTVTEEGGRGV